MAVNAIDETRQFCICSFHGVYHNVYYLLGVSALRVGDATRGVLIEVVSIYSKTRTTSEYPPLVIFTSDIVAVIVWVGQVGAFHQRTRAV